MAGENLVKLLQVAGAALGIPAAAAGTFAAYQNYFSTDVTCQKLRNNIIATMERNVAPETKRSLLRKDVTEFDKLCGEDDPDARAIFQAAIKHTDHADAVDAGRAPAAAAPPAESAGAHATPVGIFGTTGAREHYGWVALSRRKDGAWVPHFSGYGISETSLPPPGTVLAAKMMLPVWSEPQAGTNDPTKLQSRLPQGACVRVLATRGGSGRLWAEVMPASCS
ncbi:MAG TPA: hypothetical protein VH397_16855 [Xanthobacteraceae bacterium]